MGKAHKVTVNGEQFWASRGDTLLDAALMSGVNIPHDCRAGQCGSCVVNVVDGRVFGGENGDPGMVLACQCRIIAEAEFHVEDVPEVVERLGRVASVAPVAHDVFEVKIQPSQRIPYLPGQYFHVRFRGFPERCYSPTVPMDWPGDGASFSLHIQKMPGGRVSGALGSRIRTDSPVKIIGPFGNTFLREGLTNRLVLVSTGTGFAPIWSIANAAVNENPQREIVLIVGARAIESLYMFRALRRLATYPNVRIIPVTSAPQTLSKAVRIGRPTDHLSRLRKDDIVYACGAPPMVDAVKQIAAKSGVLCYADSFDPNEGDGDDGLWSRVMNWFTVDRAAAFTKPLLALPAPRKKDPAPEAADREAHAKRRQQQPPRPPRVRINDPGPYARIRGANLKLDISHMRLRMPT